MKLLNRHRVRSQRGAALVEFTIVVPLLLIFLFGIVEFSLIMYNKQMITNASREGARYGIVARNPNRTIAEIQSIINDWAGQRLINFDTETLIVTVEACNPEPPASENCSTNPLSTDWDDAKVVDAKFDYKLRVNISYNYDFLLLPNIPIFGTENNLLGDLTLEAETVMNYE